MLRRLIPVVNKPRRLHTSLRKCTSEKTKVRVIEQTFDEDTKITTIYGRLLDNIHVLTPPSEAKDTNCPICSNNINIRWQDVLILRQFLDHNNRVYPREETGVCPEQHEKLCEAIRLAQSNNVLPKPDDFEMPYRFSERESMKNVQINFLPNTRPDFRR